MSLLTNKKDDVHDLIWGFDDCKCKRLHLFCVSNISVITVGVGLAAAAVSSYTSAFTVICWHAMVLWCRAELRSTKGIQYKLRCIRRKQPLGRAVHEALCRESHRRLSTHPDVAANSHPHTTDLLSAPSSQPSGTHPFFMSLFLHVVLRLRVCLKLMRCTSLCCRDLFVISSSNVPNIPLH